MSEVRVDVKPVKGDKSRVFAIVNNCKFENLANIGLVIQRPGHDTSFLGVSGWQAAEHTTLIENGERQGSSVVLQLGPDIVSHMNTGSYNITLYEQGQNSELKGVLVWSRSIPKYRPKQGTAGSLAHGNKANKRVDESKIGPATASLPPIIDDQASETSNEVGGHEKKERSSSGIVIAIFIVMLIGSVAAAVYYLDLFPADSEEQVASQDPPGTEQEPEAEPAPEPVPVQLSLNDRLAQFIATDPSIDALLKQASEHENQREYGAAMSLFRRAGGMGSGEAYARLARLYDPSSPALSGGPVQKGDKAYGYYLKAIELNSENAKKSAKKLTKWAEKQASIGNEQAQRLLQFIALNDRGSN